MTSDTTTLWFGLLWLLVTALVLMLPLLPALRELRQGSDAAALRIDANDNGRTEYSAQRVFARLPLLEDSDMVTAWQRDARGVLIVPDRHPRLRIKTLLPLVFQPQSRASIIVSENSVEVHAQSRITHILHGKTILTMGPARLAPLTSARKRVVMSAGTQFQRVSSPCTYTWPFRRHVGPPLHFVDLGPQGTRTRLRHDGDMRIAMGSVHRGDLVVMGHLHMKASSVIIGRVKVHGNVVLEPGARVHGALFALGDITAQGANFVQGPLCADKTLRIGADSQVGSHHHVTSVSAHVVELASSIRVCGSITAFSSGRVIT